MLRRKAICREPLQNTTSYFYPTQHRNLLNSVCLDRIVTEKHTKTRRSDSGGLIFCAAEPKDMDSISLATATKILQF